MSDLGFVGLDDDVASLCTCMLEQVLCSFGCLPGTLCSFGCLPGTLGPSGCLPGTRPFLAVCLRILMGFGCFPTLLHGYICDGYGFVQRLWIEDLLEPLV